MNCNFMLSLEHRALIKTVITQWNPDDINWRDDNFNKEDHVIGKVKELPLPESLKKKISGFIKPIFFEILKWLMHYVKILSSSELNCRSFEDELEKSLSKLCWTPQGTVDRKKTAEELIRDEDLDITERYKLACIHCLRNDILMLWNKMPECCRKSFYSEEDPRLVKQHELVVFWTYDIKGERTRLNDIFEHAELNPNEYAFECAVKYRNKVATEYFLQYLTSVKREEFLVRAAGLICNEYILIREDDGDVLFFLLSQMNEEQQSKTLKKFSWGVLTRLLDWPWQDFFMETANYVWAYLHPYGYLSSLKKIIEKVKDGYKDYDYKKLFREFWQQSPKTHKKFVTDNYFSGNFLLKLFKVEDGEYFNIIFASISDRQKLLFSENGKQLCKRLIDNDKMHLVEVFVRECMTSKDVRMKFKEELYDTILHCLINKTPEEEKEDKFSEFIQLLDELIQEDDNRKRVDEGNTDPTAKRFCSHVSKE